MVVILVLLLAGVVTLQAQYNGWNTTNSGKWEVGSNWLLGTPPGTNDVYESIFEGTAITITIDAITSGSFPNTMTVNNVAIDAPAVMLELNNAGTTVPLHILDTLDISGYGNAEVIVTNSALQVDGALFVGDQYGQAASLELDSGWAHVGGISLGNGGYGFINLYGGTMTVQGGMTLGGVPGAGGGGTVQMYGGMLTSTNDPIDLGSNGYGGFAMYGGSVQAQGFQIGAAVGSQGQLFVEGGTMLVSSNILVGNNLVTNQCSVVVASNSYYGTFGTLIVTNAAGTASIEVAQNGSLTLNGGSLIVDNLILTNGGTFTNQAGSFQLVPPLNIANGGSVVLTGSTNTFDSGVQLGSATGGTGSLTLQSNTVMNVASNLVIVSSSLTSTSSVTLNGGSLILSNGPVQVGSVGSGQLIITGGNHVIQQLLLGSSNNLGSGLFHMSGGYLKILGTGTGPGQGLISNWVIVDGGDLDGSGSSFTVGDGHSSDAYLTGNGTASFANGYVGYSPGYTGIYDQTNGTMFISSSLSVGTAGSGGAVGAINLFGGTLYVTNATHTAVLDVVNGTMVVNAGATLVVDNLVITNGCGHLMKMGGGMVIQNNPPNLSPNLDADGNGESNAYKAAAGLDPLDPSSVFVVTGAVVTNKTDLSVSWTTEGGHSYVVQTNGNLGSGVFSDLPKSLTVVNGTGAGTTNYVISGAATNRGGFYRVRLGP
ncbi:MAG TPA: hypothetical protein VNU95_13540 [Candidatus Acidoferrales bacterium]|jgi:hypothetical protein|nr:hypothetical protein [Candidatus Acidoferrales bacterium]